MLKKDIPFFDMSSFPVEKMSILLKNTVLKVNKKYSHTKIIHVLDNVLIYRLVS